MLRTILLVKLLNLEDELTRQNHVIVEFVPRGERCELRTRYVRKWAEIKPVDYAIEQVASLHQREYAQNLERTGLKHGDHVY